MRGPHTRLHGRIPQAGPCSTFRRVGDFGRNPLWAGTVLACGLTSDRLLGTNSAFSSNPFLAKTVTAQRVFHCVRDS
jgi:hypothetical protein